MKLARVRVENFGPYYGPHEIDLSVGSHAPVILVHGENLHGKTSLLNAIRWCLYQRAFDRRNEQMPFKELINYHAVDDGNWVASVRLEFTHDGVLHELERQMQAAREPVADSDFEIVQRLRVGGQFEKERTIDDRIASILHEDISNFFFFDGEMLNRYEDLVADEAGGAAIIKRSIEQILGLPAMQELHADLTDVHRAAGRRQTKALEAAQKDVEFGRQAEQLREQIEAVEKDLAELQHELAIEQAKKEELRQRRRRLGEVEAEARELATLDQDIEQLGLLRKEQQALCRTALSDSWWLTISPLANARLDEAEAQMAELSEQVAAAHVNVAERDRAREALTSGRCPTCQVELTDATRTELERHAAEDDHGEPADLTLALAELSAKVKWLRELAALGPVESVRSAHREYRRLGIEIRRKQRRAEAIRATLGDDPATLGISALEHEYDDVVERLRNINDSIQGQEAVRDDAENKLRGIEAKIRRLPGADPKIATEAAALELLRDIFDRAIDVFRTDLREQVESEATQIFTELITAADLTSLHINDQYGLRIVNRAGREITTRAAGAEQVVALSLIAALNRCAVREGPIVMDTPFGRLDRSHRKNILEYVPHFGPQVVLLVQSGEFERDRDLDYLGSSVAREYEIVRVNDLSTQSEFREVA